MNKISLKKMLTNSAGRQDQSSKLPSRITNETVAEHREQILAGGRRFKYPLQYARHKLVLNATIIAFISLLLLAGIGFHQLYVVQNASDFMYRVTQLVPVPVATIANEPVLYRDYLIRYRGSSHYLEKYDEIKLDTENGKRQLDRIKRQALDTAEADAYARKLARDLNIKVTDADVNSVIDQQRNTANGKISQEAYDASSKKLLGYSPSDYKQAVRQSILRAKVAFVVDERAKANVDKATGLVQQGKDMQAVAASLGEGYAVQATGMINTTSSLSGLNIGEVSKLPVNTISAVLKSVTDDGYFFVRVVDKNDTQVSFEFVQIPLTEFNAKIEQLKKSNQVHEFINVPEQ